MGKEQRKGDEKSEEPKERDQSSKENRRRGSIFGRVCTISDIIQQHPLQQGLPELFAYFGVLSRFKSTCTDKQQSITFDATQNKRIIIPEIIISR